MSRTWITPFEREELAFECGLCGAEPDVWCTSRSGRLLSYLHSERFYDAKAARNRAAALAPPARPETEEASHG